MAATKTTTAKKTGTTTKTTSTKATSAQKGTTSRAAKAGTRPRKAPARTSTSTTPQATAEAAASFERSFAARVSAGAYALIGVGDAGIELLRRTPDQAAKLADAPKAARDLVVGAPGQLAGQLDRVRSSLASELDAYAGRGRKVVDGIATSAPTKRAVGQAKTARTQVRAATTSVRKAADAGAEAVDKATDKVGTPE